MLTEKQRMKQSEKPELPPPCPMPPQLSLLPGASAAGEPFRSHLGRLASLSPQGFFQLQPRSSPHMEETENKRPAVHNPDRQTPCEYCPAAHRGRGTAPKRGRMDACLQGPTWMRQAVVLGTWTSPDPRKWDTRGKGPPAGPAQAACRQKEAAAGVLRAPSLAVLLEESGVSAHEGRGLACLGVWRGCV